MAAQDVARIAIETAAGDDGLTVDAAGEEILTFEELARLIARAVRSRARLLHAPPRLARFLANLVAASRRDVMLTREELSALQQELLISHRPPLGRVSCRAWVGEHAEELGARYVSGRARNWRIARR